MKISTEQLIGELREYSATLKIGIGLAVEDGCWAIEKYFRSEVAAADAFIAHLEATASTQPEATPAKPRCSFHREIRRAFAIMREAGLNAKADDAMRAAFGRYLGRTIESREAMNGHDWFLVGNAIKAHALAW